MAGTFWPADGTSFELGLGLSSSMEIDGIGFVICLTVVVDEVFAFVVVAFCIVDLTAVVDDERIVVAGFVLEIGVGVGV